MFVDPDRTAGHGSLVVVRRDDEREATFKKLVVEGDRRYLRALNPAWPEPILAIDGNATLCGVVIFKGEVTI
ncbi:MAG: S24 family peptidase [Candidatus Accumulibacter sp.]|nr:S24 family peptidase [Accumulibacter sp.]MCM8596936.1 S24 family peptidase [Accumulibacter sp.]MCM8624430.1 S24 family peptidase [Accumulibacter sp.]